MQAEDERDYVQYVEGRILPLRRTAYRLCGDWHYAHDLVQTALIQLYQHWQHVSAAGAMDAYVRRMLVNVFLEEQRRWWARKVRPSPAMPEQPAPDSDPTDDHLDLKAPLARLSRGQRAVLVLRYWESLDVAETADALGCSPGTV